MCKNRIIEEEGSKSVTGLKHFIRKLQSQLQVSKYVNDIKGAEESNKPASLTADIKEGHFVVFAVKTEVPKRFVVELRFLTNPAFLRLLKQAEEEYGFGQKGALAIPCQPQELQKVLLDG